MNEIEKIMAEMQHAYAMYLTNKALYQATFGTVYKIHAEKFKKQMCELARDLIGTMNSIKED